MQASFERGRRLALDVGRSRIGVAVCDPDGILASPVKTINRATQEQVTSEFKQLVADFEPTQIFIGLPRNLQNLETESTLDAIEVGGWMLAITDAEVLFVDERLTTVTAKQAMRQAGRSEKSSRSVIDQQAACIILETALQSLKAGKPAGLRTEELGI